MLAKASPIFKIILRLPTSQINSADSQSNDVSSDVDELPIIDITESSETLEILLRFIYPGVRPSYSECGALEAVTALMEASRKYEMLEVMEFFKEVLMAPAQSDPLRVFCIAVHLGFLDEAVVAAKRCLGHSMRPLPLMPPEINFISSPTLYRLLQYLERCRQTAVVMTSDLKNVMKVNRYSPSTPWTWMGQRSECMCDKGTVIIVEWKKTGRRECVLLRWWTDYMQQATAALEDKPLGSTVMSSTIMLPALRTAGACPVCGPVVVDQLSQFGKGLAKRIDDAIDEVELDLGL